MVLNTICTPEYILFLTTKVIRINECKLKLFQIDIIGSRYVYLLKVVNLGNNLPRSVIEIWSVNMFKIY